MNAFITTGTTMKLTIKRIIYWGVLSLLLISMNTYATQPTHLSPKAQAFVNYMVKVHHFNRKKLTALLAQVKYNEEVIFKITHPYEAQPWNVYRAHFLTPERIQQGVLYWQKHATALRYAQQHYGVPTRVIVAIIGVESHYGERTGTYIALNALSTLAFNYPQRSKFFTKELAQFLLLTKEQQLPALSTKSSYAGALGIPQFMPSTYRHYAVGYAKKSHANIITVDADAIVSIANYLRVNGWKRNQPIACAFSSKKPFNSKIVSKRPRLRTTVRQLKKMGIHPAIAVPANQKAAIVELKNQQGTEHWLIFHNFKVIMKYNPRVSYAMAVYQLSEAIEKAYDQQAPGARPTTTAAGKA